MSNLKIVTDDEEFNALVDGADDELVVIDFSTAWCGPCKKMEPVFEAMAGLYPSALFLKVDADNCFDTAMNYKVKGVPFFVICFNKTVLATVQGANPQELEMKLKSADIEARKVAPSKSAAATPSPLLSSSGRLLSSVVPYVDQENSYCLNDLSPTSFHIFIQGKKLVSGRGTGKIMLVYSFTQKMMLRSFKIKANYQTGPKVLRFFVNHPKVLDFSVGSTLAPSQEVTLNHHDLHGETPIPLRSGSFQIVTNLQILVSCGQVSNSSRIEIESLEIFGAPLSDTTARVSSAQANSSSSRYHYRKIEQPTEDDIEDNNAFAPSCQDSALCSVSQPQQPNRQELQQYHKQQRRSSYVNDGNYNNVTDQRFSGHSKYTLADPASPIDNVDPEYREREGERDYMERVQDHHHHRRRHHSSHHHR